VKLFYLTRDKIDTIRYDKCVEHSVNGSLFAYSWYLDIVSPNWDVIVDEHYKCVMPLPFLISKRKKRIFQPSFTPYLVIISNYLLVPSLTSNFIQEVDAHFSSISLVLNKMNAYCNLKNISFSKITFYELDLILNYNNLYHNYLKEGKESVKDQNNFDFKKEINLSQLLHFWALNSYQSSHQYVEKEVTVFKALIEELINKNVCKIKACYSSKGELCTVSVWVWSNYKLLLIFYLSNKEAIDKQLLVLSIDSIIQEHATKAISLCLPTWINNFEFNPNTLGILNYSYSCITKEKKSRLRNNNILNLLFHNK